jgi:hypothetical protein
LGDSASRYRDNRPVCTLLPIFFFFERKIVGLRSRYIKCGKLSIKARRVSTSQTEVPVTAHALFGAAQSWNRTESTVITHDSSRVMFRPARKLQIDCSTSTRPSPCWKQSQSYEMIRTQHRPAVWCCGLSWGLGRLSITSPSFSAHITQQRDYASYDANNIFCAIVL